LLIEPVLSTEPESEWAGWLPAAFNCGHRYPDRVSPADAGRSVSAFYAGRYRHTEAAEWLLRLAAGEIERNGQPLRDDVALAVGDRLIWHRPPWQEAAVPALPGPLFDDGDLTVFAKPSGLPVLPAGGFLEHTLLRQIERRVAAGDLDGAAGLPRPVHRLGRFTSGLLLCARRPATRAWLSAQLRESTAAHDPAGARCHKTYRALLQPPVAGSPLLDLAPGDGLELRTPIGRRPHARLGSVWAAALPDGPPPLEARSSLCLLERGGTAIGGLPWLVEVTIATGRPHQIRIHTAAAGAPLLGDPLYAPGGSPLEQALPGDGGYHLHAHRLRLPLPDGEALELEAPLPEGLCPGAAAGARG
jgi:23S rRNA pseudouridine1911/1915/1917 synthase